MCPWNVDSGSCFPPLEWFAEDVKEEGKAEWRGKWIADCAYCKALQFWVKKKGKEGKAREGWHIRSIKKCPFYTILTAGNKKVFGGLIGCSLPGDPARDGRIGFLLCVSHEAPVLIGPKYKIAPGFWNCPQFSTAGDKKLKEEDNPWEMLCDVGTWPPNFVIYWPNKLKCFMGCGNYSSCFWWRKKNQKKELCIMEIWAVPEHWKCLEPSAQGFSFTSLSTSGTETLQSVPAFVFCVWGDTRTGWPRLGYCV